MNLRPLQPEVDFLRAHPPRKNVEDDAEHSLKDVSEDNSVTSGKSKIKADGTSKLRINMPTYPKNEATLKLSVVKNDDKKRPAYTNSLTIKAPVVVFLDPGHGGDDSGATSQNCSDKSPPADCKCSEPADKRKCPQDAWKEADVVWDIVDKIKDHIFAYFPVLLIFRAPCLTQTSQSFMNFLISTIATNKSQSEMYIFYALKTRGWILGWPAGSWGV